MTFPTDDSNNMDDHTPFDTDPAEDSSSRNDGEARRYQPTRKARAIFEDVEVRGLTLDEVTDKWNVTSRAVNEIVERVRSYMRLTVRQKMADRQWIAIQQLLRIEYQWQEAMRAWNSSQVDRRRLHSMLKEAETAMGMVEMECRTKVGDVRFLQLGQRLMADVRTLMGEVHNVLITPGDQDDDDTLTVEQRREEIDRILGQDGQRGRSETDAASAGGAGPGDLD